MVRITSNDPVNARVSETLARQKGISQDVKVIGTIGANLRVEGVKASGRITTLPLSSKNVTITDTRTKRIQTLQTNLSTAAGRRFLKVRRRFPTRTEEQLQVSLVPRLRTEKPEEIIIGASLLATPIETGQIRVRRQEPIERMEEFRPVFREAPKVETAAKRLSRAIETREIFSGILGPRAIAKVSAKAQTELLFPPTKPGVIPITAEEKSFREGERFFRGVAAVPVGTPAAVFETIADPLSVVPTKEEAAQFGFVPETTRFGLGIASIVGIAGRPRPPKVSVPKVPRFKVKEVIGLKRIAAKTLVERVKGEPVILGATDILQPIKIKTKIVVPFKKLKVKDPSSEFIVREIEKGRRVERFQFKKDIEFVKRERITAKPPKITKEPVLFKGELRKIEVRDILGGRRKRGVFEAEFLQPIRLKEKPFIKIQKPTLPKEKRTPLARSFLVSFPEFARRKRAAPRIFGKPSFRTGPFAQLKPLQTREIFTPIPIGVTKIKAPSLKGELKPIFKGFGDIAEITMLKPAKRVKAKPIFSFKDITFQKAKAKERGLIKLKPAEILKETALPKARITPRQRIIPIGKLSQELRQFTRAVPTTRARVARRAGRPRPPIVPIFPPIKFDLKGPRPPRIRDFFKKPKQPKAFVPSLAAPELKAFAFKEPKGIFTGLEIRPIIIKKRKKRKKKR